ncbi:hypothetical protein MVEN_01753100 [Mycena venus]|uniref:Mid2 domain-containing protein n=1 Tax=Mycena venus TaxID=2733690 RepID=A0A8H6XKD8_9AGAR|nr:hypothetical protein MVEN_01753100 [Mycena venus]
MYARAAILLVGALSEMSVYGYVRRADPTPISSASPASITPVFSFNKITGMTTCVPATITWIYTPVTDPHAVDLTLSITNVDVSQIPSTVESAPSPVNQSLTSEPANAATGVYTWAQVNVTEGWYALVAAFPSQVSDPEKSLAFYVINGTDTSCLKSLTAATPSSTSSGTLTSTLASPSSSATQSSGSVRSKFNPRALVGGLMGGVGLLAVMTAAYLCFGYLGICRRPSRKRATRWSGVRSANSKHRAYLRNPQLIRGHSFDSFGRILPEDDYVLDIGRASGEEDNEKAESSESSSQSHGTPLALQSMFSDRQYSSDVDQTVPSPPLSGASSSHPNSQYSAMTTSTTTTDSNFSHNLPGTLVYPQLSYPPSPLPAFPSGTSFEIAAGGSSSAAGSVAGEQHTSTSAPGERRIPRKPVPQYNSADPTLTPPPACRCATDSRFL